ncbi:MAG: hypothetical protein ACR2MD_19760 [Aridibacter sp.]
MKNVKDWDEEYLFSLSSGEHDWIEFKESRKLDFSLPGINKGNNILDSPTSQDSDSAQAESFGLRFEIHNDALDYANKLTEDSNRWLSVNKLDVANRYIVGDLELNIGCIAGIATKFHFIFRSIPNRETETKTTVGDIGVFLEHFIDIYGGRSDNTVFIGVTEGVQCKEQVIPSFVWLKPF